MSKELQSILEAAMRLSLEERAELVVRLFDSLPAGGLRDEVEVADCGSDPATQSGIDDALLDEMDRRMS